MWGCLWTELDFQCGYYHKWVHLQDLRSEERTNAGI